MANVERGKSIIERTADISKKIDYVMIAAGSGIVVLFSKAIGMAIIIGSVLTIIPADMIQRWDKKRRSKASAT